MLKSLLDSPVPEPKTLEEAQAVITALVQLVLELAARVEALEERLGQDSGNSSQPPFPRRSQATGRAQEEKADRPRTWRAAGARQARAGTAARIGGGPGRTVFSTRALCLRRGHRSGTGGMSPTSGIRLARGSLYGDGIPSLCGML